MEVKLGYLILALCLREIYLVIRLGQFYCEARVIKILKMHSFKNIFLKCSF